MSANKSDTDNLPWIEKYRPERLDDVYGQSDIVETVRKFAEGGKLPHLLFYGPPGTGKTSTISALAREIYGKDYRNMVLELNASDDRGIEVVRNQIKEFASTRQIFSKGYKLIILDEADAMTSAAQNALRRIIEKFTKNTRFCILANYIHKLTPAIISRCTRFRFQPLPQHAIELRINNVMAKERLQLSESAKEALLRLSNGDMRKALNVMQAAKATLDNPEKDTIGEDVIYECIGAVRPKDLESILVTILHDDWSTAYESVKKIRMSNGLALVDMIQGLVECLESYKLKDITWATMLSNLSDIEYAISKGGNDKIQCTATISAIKSSMELEL
ncbi:HDL414Wp [Eremothecium sinecaudum]|uniref:HDL414Wp n=1 Tax=Eremothecium sinecaudum TaxID=45286 RepID=A0A0X8HRY0_9SACH|nr:HDL414Wp [Eremothecium sinecaudum]AMD20330.1 HDL414Wp [Eremothecium sinecaudum]